MNKQQAIESLARLNKESEELKKYIEGCDKEIIWNPTFGEEYFVIGLGKIIRYFFGDDFDDKSMIATGEYWQTEEEAQAELDKRLAIQRVIVWIAENLGYDSRKWADFDKTLYEKCYFYYDFDDEKIDIAYFNSSKRYSPTGYLKSREDAEKVIEACKSDLEIVYK